MLADTTWGVSVNLIADVAFASEAPALPVIAIDAAGPEELLVALDGITGRIDGG